MSKGIQYTAPPQSEKMKEALRIYIIRERQRKQKERDAEIAEQRRKELIEQERQQIRELMEETNERINELDMDVVRLKKEKQDLFEQLTEVLHKENIRKQQIKETNVTGPNTVKSMPIKSSIDSGAIMQPQLYLRLPTTTSYHQQCNVTAAATPPNASENQKVVKRSRNPLLLLKLQPKAVSTHHSGYGYKPPTTTVASYPTTTVASYSTTTVASYPTTTVASYPTTTVASYSTTTVASYSTTTVASYSTTTVASYPTTTVASYTPITTVASYTPITPVPITPVTPVSIIPVTSNSAKAFRKFGGARKYLRKRSSRKLSGANYCYGPTTTAAQSQSQPILILPEPSKSIIYSVNTPQLATIRQTTPNHIPVSGGVIPIHPLSQVTETGSITLGYPLSRTIQTPQVPYQPPAAPYVTISDASGQLLYSMLSQPHNTQNPNNT